MEAAWRVGMVTALAGLACSSQQLPDLGAGGRNGNSTSSGGGSGFAIDSGTPLSGDAQAAVDVRQDGCTIVRPPGLIADFSGANGQVFAGGAGILGGQVFSGPLTQDFSSSNWHISGQVHTGAVRFGVLWTCGGVASTGACDLDVSGAMGLQFTIKGSAGPDQALDLVLGQPEDDLVGAGCGSCPSSSSCTKPRISIDLSAARDTPQTITVLWPNVVGGAPAGTFSGKVLSSILWYLHPAPAGDNVPADADPSTADGFYPVDLTIDDIMFVPFWMPKA